MFAFFYSGSVDELTHSGELSEAMIQAFTTNCHLLKRTEWSCVNKNFQAPAVRTRLC